MDDIKEMLQTVFPENEPKVKLVNGKTVITTSTTKPIVTKELQALLAEEQDSDFTLFLYRSGAGITIKFREN